MGLCTIDSLCTKQTQHIVRVLGPTSATLANINPTPDQYVETVE